MDKPYQVMQDIDILPSHFPVPGAGFLPVHAFVIKAKELPERKHKHKSLAENGVVEYRLNDELYRKMRGKND